MFDSIVEIDKKSRVRREKERERDIDDTYNTDD